MRPGSCPNYYRPPTRHPARRKDRWQAARAVIAGRFINGYSVNDWTLGLVFKAHSGNSIWNQAAGIWRVDVPGVENVNLSKVVPGRGACGWMRVHEGQGAGRGGHARLLTRPPASFVHARAGDWVARRVRGQDERSPGHHPVAGRLRKPRDHGVLMPDMERNPVQSPTWSPAERVAGSRPPAGRGHPGISIKRAQRAAGWMPVADLTRQRPLHVLPTRRRQAQLL